MVSTTFTVLTISSIDTERLVDYATAQMAYELSGKEGGDSVATATVLIPEEKRDILKVIASTEKREMKDIITELIDEYIARHKETLELLSRPEWVEIIERGKAEVAEGVRGKYLDELED